MEDEDCREAAVGDVGWLLKWWARLFPLGSCTAPACSTDAVAFPGVTEPRDEDIAILASDQEEARRDKMKEGAWRREQEAQREQDEIDQDSYHQRLFREGECEGQDARRMPELSAGLGMGRAAQGAAETQEILGSNDDGWRAGQRDGGPCPWVSKTLRVPCPTGRGMPSLQLFLEWEEESCPDDVETVGVPSPSRGCNQGAAEGGNDDGRGITSTRLAPDEMETLPYEAPNTLLDSEEMMLRWMRKALCKM